MRNRKINIQGGVFQSGINLFLTLEEDEKASEVHIKTQFNDTSVLEDAQYKGRIGRISEDDQVILEEKRINPYTFEKLSDIGLLAIGKASELRKKIVGPKNKGAIFSISINELDGGIKLLVENQEFVVESYDSSTILMKIQGQNLRVGKIDSNETTVVEERHQDIFTDAAKNIMEMTLEIREEMVKETKLNKPTLSSNPKMTDKYLNKSEIA